MKVSKLLVITTIVTGVLLPSGMLLAANGKQDQIRDRIKDETCITETAKLQTRLKIQDPEKDGSCTDVAAKSQQGTGQGDMTKTRIYDGTCIS